MIFRYGFRFKKKGLEWVRMCKNYFTKMLTSILPPLGFVPKTEGFPNDTSNQKLNKTKFKTPFSLETVFGPDPGLEDLVLFTKSRGVVLESLDEDQKVMWRTSWRENRVLCGYLVLAVVFPSYLKRRIKLREAETHWVNLDGESPKGKTKLEQRRICLRMVESMKASSCFRGTSDIIDPQVLVRDFLELPKDNDEGVVFFRKRDFARDTSKSSSAHASCAAILSHLWFVTTILGRPCSLDSVVVPIRGEEASRLEELGICGKVTAFSVDWGNDVFPKLPGYFHDKNAGLFLERLTSDSYLDQFPSDAFLLYKAKVKNSRDKIHPGSKQAAFNLAVIPCFDTLLSRANTCDINALDVSAIAIEFGDDAAKRVRSTESVGVFSASMKLKMDEAIKLFSEEHTLVRRFVNNRLKVDMCKDPGGIKKKLAGGRLLDPRILSNVDAVKGMIKTISDRTWLPIKRVIFKLVESLDPDMKEEEMCEAFLLVKGGGAEDFQRRAKKLGITAVDVSNVCFLLCLTMSFQRSQVLRDSLVREYILTREGSGYTLSLERALKTTGADVNGFTPCREFDLSPSQSMMVHLIKLVGGRKGDQTLLINERGGNMTQNNLGARYRAIGKAFLGISNLSPHAMRTFFTSHVIDSGKVAQRDLNELGSYLQVSSKTLSTAYIASSTNTEAHRIGKRALGDVINSGASVSRKMTKGHPESSFDTASRPKGKLLGKARDIYKERILDSVKGYKNIGECFNALVEQRKQGYLDKKHSWFEFRNTFFSDEDTKFFTRFVQKRMS